MNTEQKTAVAVIPFSGFYESVHNLELDCCLEQIFRDDHGDIDQDIFETATANIDWKGIHIEYSKTYVARFAKHYEIEGMTFDKLDSPREYNFGTDRIFVNIPLKSLQAIGQQILTRKLHAHAIDMFTDHSGFISHYDPDPKTWGSLETWDHNQVFCLLETYVHMTNKCSGFANNYQDNCLMDDLNCNGEMDDLFVQYGMIYPDREPDRQQLIILANALLTKIAGPNCTFDATSNDQIKSLISHLEGGGSHDS